MHVVTIVHKNSQLKQKRCQNDERLWSYGSSKIVINLIQREMISLIEDFGLLSRSFNKQFLFLKDVFFFFSDVSDPRLTQNVSRFDEWNAAEDEKSCFHSRWRKIKTVATLCVPDVRETFGFIYLFIIIIILFILFIFFFFFADNFIGSKDTEPYKMDVSFFVSVYNLKKSIKSDIKYCAINSLRPPIQWLVVVLGTTVSYPT